MKLKCPDCDARIEFCVEEMILHKRIIEPLTGNFKKRIRQESQGNEADRALFQCTNCSWSCADGSPEYRLYLNACNQENVNQLLEYVGNKPLGSIL